MAAVWRREVEKRVALQEQRYGKERTDSCMPSPEKVNQQDWK